MNLRKYSIIMTGIAASSLASQFMWFFTKCDVITILLVVILIIIITTFFYASSDGVGDEIADYKRYKKAKAKERKLYIYDMK